ncbi:hypothetical protein JTE90_029434, partial [Oedothorax gibbosus]
KIFVCFKKLDKYILLLAVGSSEKNQYQVSQAAIIKKILENIDTCKSFLKKQELCSAQKYLLNTSCL